MARRKRRGSRGIMSKVRTIVKKEVGKTREVQKLVSYLSYSQIPRLVDSDEGGDDASQGLLLSLTGGVNPQLSQGVLNPNALGNKDLFVMLPAQYSTGGGTLQGVNQAAQGGVAMQSTALGDDNIAIGGVHQLEGRQCYLKTWYATMVISNSPQQVSDPRPCFVRMVVFETRRPLARTALASQIFLQNHAVASMNPSVAGQPETVCSYLNRAIVKKIHYDRLIKLTGPAGTGTAGGSSAQLYTTKIKVKLNKKAHWAYYYNSDDPSEAGERLQYTGPFVYALFCGNQNNANRFPVIAINTMLTFYDD